MYEQVRIGALQLLQHGFPDRGYGRDAADLAFGRERVLRLDGKGFKPVARAATATEMSRAHIPSSSIMRRSVTWTFGLL